MDSMAQEELKRVAIIIGAGPAGLTAAYELLTKTNIKPIVLESDPTYVGGISKTVRHKGNRIDIGGHRFFSKSDTVMDWWLHILPLESNQVKQIAYQGNARTVSAGSGSQDNVMLVRQRLSRIYYDRKFFLYPITLSIDTVRKLGLLKMIKIGCSYLYRILFPRRPEKTLEDFFKNRFGDELYKTFFKSYTEKVWGKPCGELSADWGAQRVKGLSIMKALTEAILKPFRKHDIKQKGTETSLIEQFLYPKYGPGHLWETVAIRVKELGGEIKMGTQATGLVMREGMVVEVHTEHEGKTESLKADYVFSTTSIKDLAKALGSVMPTDVASIANALEFRDFITIGVLVKKDYIEKSVGSLDDTWIYVHDPTVLVGRIQVFNSWSPYMVADQDYYWLGLEYFCDEGDSLWNRTDAELGALAAKELEILGFIKNKTIKDTMVLREKKTYPVYAGAYAEFPKVQEYLDSIQNLFPVGRNGMHRYNNQDHSMLTAIAAVDLIRRGSVDKSGLWSINTDQDYHEEKHATSAVSYRRQNY
jgi:protoporphyrinogen oxidase